MDYPELASPDDLQGLDGGPFTSQSVKAACKSVRRLAGWHIAPVVTETMILDSIGGHTLWLPTRHVESIESVRDVSGDTPRDLSRWAWSAGGMIQSRECFPCGYRSVEVTLTHGYDECPEDLLPVIAERTRRTIVQESLAGRSVTFGVDGGSSTSTIARYSLGPRP